MNAKTKGIFIYLLLLSLNLHALTLSENGLSIELPADWAAVNQTTNFFIHERAASPDGSQFVSAGVVIIPSATAKSLTAAGLAGVKGINHGKKSVAEELGVSMEQLEKIWNDLGGKDNWKALDDLGKISVESVSAVKVNSRNGYLARLNSNFQGKTVAIKQWMVEGYSPGQIFFLVAASPSSQGLETSPMPDAVRISDTRVVENRFPGFRLMLPQGTSWDRFTKEQSRTAGRFKYPIGLRGEGIAQVSTLISSEDPKKFFNDARDGIKNKSKNYKELKSAFGQKNRLSFGEAEIRFTPADGSIGENVVAETIYYGKPEKGENAILLVFTYPVEVADVIRPMSRAIIDTVTAKAD